MGLERWWTCQPVHVVYTAQGEAEQVEAPKEGVCALFRRS